MVDKTLHATKIAAIRDAAARVRQVLPSDRAVFAADRSHAITTGMTFGVAPLSASQN